MASRKEGMSLGPYRLIEQIGLGGMATVYKAYQPSMDRYVAVKVLPAYYAQDPKFIERFNREARTIARLEHRNILPVHDFGEENGVTYLVMRYLDGGTLKDMLALGRLTLADAVDILCQVCAALDYAHRQGVVHRDVKPANIMVDSEGTAYLTDFGIAKALESAPGGLTETGASIGTPAYMAPEQSLGQPVDRRSDIYALGVILYEVAVGQPPYQADTPMAVALAHIHEPLPLPRDIDPNLPEALERVILKALAKKPEDRYQTASEMSEALSQALAEGGISRADTTLKALATQARDQIASQTVKVTPETFAPAGVAKMTIPAQPRRGLSPLVVAGAVAGVAIVIGGAFLIGQRLGLWGSRAPGAAGTQAVTTPAVGIAPPTVAPATAVSYVYDNFDNPAFDGSSDPSLWLRSEWGCTQSQMQGSMVIYNAPSSGSDVGCRLTVSRPTRVSPAELGTLQARLKFRQTSTEGNSNNSMTLRGYSLTGDQLWQANWGLGASQAGVTVFFNMQNVDNGTYSFQESASREWPAEADRWYTFQVKLDPTTMIITCLVDGQLLASVAPDNAVGVKDQLIERGLDNWRSPSAVAVGAVDDFTILPPALAQAAAPPAVTAPPTVAPATTTAAPTAPPTAVTYIYDNFDNPAFEGSFDSSLWVTQFGSTCAYHQVHGSMVVNNDPSSTDSYCALIAKRPKASPEELGALQARLKISQVSAQGYLDSAVQLIASIGQQWLWSANCGLSSDSGHIGVFFSISNSTSSTSSSVQTSADRWQQAESDRWYTFQLKTDPATRAVTCLVDGQVLASAVPDNGRPSQGLELALANYRKAMATALTSADDFTILPPGVQ